MDKSSDILVSVIVLTYNHEKYIKQALDSILMQTVNFQYEILVGDDCSHDSTARILKEYKKNHPNLFRIFIRKKNLGATKNLYHLLKNSRGKYIASLEGDDFWSDSDKLMKQIDFLEKNQKYSGCSHACVVVDEEGMEIYEKNIPNDNNFWCFSKDIFDIEDFSRGKFGGHGATIVFRNFFIGNMEKYDIIYKAHSMIADRTLLLLICAKGKIYHMHDQMLCYRYVEKVEADNWQSQSRYKNKRYEEFHYIRTLEEYAKRNYDSNFNMDEVKKEKLICGTVVFLNKINIINFSVVLNMILDSGAPWKYFSISLKTIILKLYYRKILKEDRKIKL